MKYLKVFTDFREAMEMLSDAEKGRLFVAMLDYADNGQLPDLRGNERFVWGAAKTQIDRAQERCGINSENGKKGGRPTSAEKPNKAKANESEINQTKANESEINQTKANETEQKPIKKREERKGEEKKGEGVVDTPAPANMPFGLTDAEIDASRARDQAIEQAARDAGLPYFPANIETAHQLANDFGMEWLLEAIKRTADGKAQTWGYVKGILRSWRDRGGMDAENRPKAADGGKRVTAQGYTQRNYTDAELNAGTLDLLREAMEI